jgi:hypothetical protein
MRSLQVKLDRRIIEKDWQGSPDFIGFRGAANKALISRLRVFYGKV